MRQTKMFKQLSLHELEYVVNLYLEEHPDLNLESLSITVGHDHEYICVIVYIVDTDSHA